MHIYVHQALVCAHDLLHVYGAINVVCEHGVGIEFLVQTYDLLEFYLLTHHGGAEDATGEVATVGYEVDGAVEGGLQFVEALQNFWHVLMLECLVYTHIATAP